MKHFLKFFGIIALVAIIGFSFIACNTTTTPDPTNPEIDGFVWIPAGTFTMGSEDPLDSPPNASPAHPVTLTKGFYMGKYEVTQAQFEAVMGWNNSDTKGDDFPAVGLTWYETLVFCNTLSMQEGLIPAYSISGSTDPAQWGPERHPSQNEAWDAVVCDWNANGFRLPTEAEWEYAAKGGNGSPGNYIYPGSNTIDDVAWYGGNSGGTLHAVGTKAPNGLGIYDMGGNVWELVWDWLGDYSSGAQTDPRGPASGISDAARGGSWDSSNAVSCRSAKRGVASRSSNRNGYVGFRVVRGE
jgi:formylglycine-generating enzyme required for sulfatase activity